MVYGKSQSTKMALGAILSADSVTEMVFLRGSHEYG